MVALAKVAGVDMPAHLRARRDFHLVVDSVLNQAVVSELVHRCDVVYHLAAAVGVRLIVDGIPALVTFMTPAGTSELSITRSWSAPG